MGRRPRRRRALTDPAPDDLAAVFATGGTTGIAKGVCYSYRTLSAIAGNYVDLLDEDDRAEISIRSSLPPLRSPTSPDACASV